MSLENNVPLSEFLKHVCGQVFSVCEIFYERYLKIEKDPQTAANLLKMFYAGNVDTDETEEVRGSIDGDKMEEMVAGNAPMIEKLVDNIIAENPTEDDFYLQIWEMLNNTIIFPQEEDVISGIIAIYYLGTIPYYQLLKAPTMDEKTFKTALKNIEPTIAKAFFALNCNYEQKTQLATQLIYLYDQISDLDEKKVYVATLFGKALSKIQSSDKKIKELEDELKILKEEN